MLLLMRGVEYDVKIGYESVIYGVRMLALCLAPDFVVVCADVLLSGVRVLYEVCSRPCGWLRLCWVFS
jgi:hypothetical protein